MKAYLMTTAVVFGAVVLAHGARVAAEGVRLIAEPTFVLTTMMAVGLCGWGVYLLWRWKEGRP